MGIQQMQAVAFTVLEIISSLTFSFARTVAWKLVITSGWLVFISTFNYFVPT